MGRFLVLVWAMIFAFTARAEAQRQGLGAISQNFSVLAMTRPITGAGDPCQSVTDTAATVCLLGNGSVIFVKLRAEKTFAYVLSAAHVVFRLCEAARDGRTISATAGLSAFPVALDVQSTDCSSVLAAPVEYGKDRPDVGLAVIDVSQIRSPITAPGQPPLPPNSIEAIPIAGYEQQLGEVVAAFGIRTNRTAFYRTDVSIQRLPDGPAWEIVAGVDSEPGLSGSPLLQPIKGSGFGGYGVIGPIVKEGESLRCDFSGGRLAPPPDWAIALCAVDRSKIELHLSRAHDLRYARSVLKAIPTDDLELNTATTYLDKFFEFLPAIERLGQTSTFVQTSGQASDRGDALSRAKAFLGEKSQDDWRRYFKKLSNLQRLRLLVYLDDKMATDNCYVAMLAGRLDIFAALYGDIEGGDELRFRPPNAKLTDICRQRAQNMAQGALTVLFEATVSDPRNVSFSSRIISLGSRFSLSKAEAHKQMDAWQKIAVSLRRQTMTAKLDGTSLDRAVAAMNSNSILMRPEM